MGDNTGIEWTDASWNPVSGCAKVSAGCKHCYAERDWGRLVHLPAYRGRAFTDVAVHPDRLDQPLRWRRPRRIFVNSMSDLFHEAVPFRFIDKVFAVMALADHHTFQVLTKRPDRMRTYLSSENRKAGVYAALLDMCGGDADEVYLRKLADQDAYLNVWLGVTAEDQEAADQRVIELFQTPAAVRWVSVEPMIGAIDVRWALSRNPLDIVAGFLERGCFAPGLESIRRLDWVVVGGESGPKARPMHPAWVRSLRDQCQAAGVPFLFKQWGEWAPAEIVPGGDLGAELRKGTVQHIHAPGNPEGFFRKGDAYVRRIGKKAAGRLLDGEQHDGYPEVRHG